MKKKYIVLIVVALVIVALAAAGVAVMNSINVNLKALSSVTVTDPDLTMVPDGTYEGSYGGIPVSAVVKVKVAAHKITAIEIVKHENGKGAGAEVLPEKVISAQSVEIDTISGATYSSKVILKAIENALEKAINQNGERK